MTTEISTPRTFRNEPRRSFSAQYKRELVEMVLASPTSQARLAREHGLNQNQLARWRREYERGKYAAPDMKAAALVPVCVTVTPAVAIPPAQAPVSVNPDTSLSVQLHLPKGTVSINGISEPLLRRLIEAMQ